MDEPNIYQNQFSLGEGQLLKVDTPNGRIIIQHLKAQEKTQVAIYYPGGDDQRFGPNLYALIYMESDDERQGP